MIMDREELLYSDMTDRELMEHIARNSDQILGFLSGMVDRHVTGEEITNVISKATYRNRSGRPDRK